MRNATLRGNSNAGNPHVQFDEGESASAKPRRGLLACKKLLLLVVGFVQLTGMASIMPTITTSGTWNYTVTANQDSAVATDVFVVDVPDGCRALVTVSGYRRTGNASSWSAYLSEGQAIRHNFSGSSTSWSTTYTTRGSFVLHATVFGDSYYITGKGSVPYKYYYCELSYTVTVKYEALLPNLTVSSFSAAPSSEAAVDEPVSLSYSVKNVGSKASGATSVQIKCGETLLNECQVPALGNGATSTGTIALPKMAAGEYVLSCAVDTSKSVQESSESDNSSTIRYRIYARTPVSVLFVPNNGSVTQQSSVVAGNVVGSMPVPCRKGYSFDGWWTENTGGRRVDVNEKITSARTFYAHWAAQPSVLVFNHQGGSGDASRTATCENNLPKVTIPTRKGYTFDGYWTEPDGKGEQYYSASGEGVKTWDHEIDTVTLYAKWVPVKGSVVLDVQGGTGGTASVAPAFGAVMPRVTPPTRMGWAFQGYYSVSNGVGVQYYVSSGLGCQTWDRVDGSTVTLYGYWLPNQMNYSLTLDKQDGSGGSDTATATYAAALPKIVPPTRAKYVFEGYYSEPNGKGVKYYDEEGSGLISKSELMDDVVLYAKWTAAFCVRLVPNGAIGLQTTHYFLDRRWILPHCPYSMDGKVFAGWSFEPTGVPTFADGACLSRTLLGYDDQIPDEPVSLYAIWGDVLETKLYPGIRFVTGGHGAQPCWSEVGDLLRSSGTASNSWLCATFDEGGEVRADLMNTFSSNYIRSETVWASEGKVYTNLSGSAYSSTVSFVSGSHLVTWVCRKDGAYVDQNGYCKLTGLFYDKSCLVGFLLDGASNWEWIKQLMNELVNLEVVYDVAVSDLCDLFLNGVNFVNYYRRDEARKYVMDGLDDYRTSNGTGSIDSDRFYRYRYYYSDATIPMEPVYAYIISLLGGRGGFNVSALNKLYGYQAQPIESILYKRFYPCVTQIWCVLNSIEDGNVMRARMVTMDAALGELPVPETPTGYVFDGWWTDSQGGEQATENTLISTETTLYAHWKKQSFKLSFSTGTSENCDAHTVSYGERIGTLPTPTRDGYAFAGWAYQSSGTMASIGDTLSADTVLVAQWTSVTDWGAEEKTISGWVTTVDTPVMRQVAFDANGGSASAASRSVSDGAAVGALPTASRSGYAFLGWYTAANGGSAVSVSTKVTANVTYYAHWKKDAKDIVEDTKPVVADDFAATTYDGYLYDETKAAVAGMIQVKAAKAKVNKKSGNALSKLTVSIQLKNETKKISISGEYDLGIGGEQTFSAKDGRAVKLNLGTNGMVGSFAGYRIEGVPNVFGLKDTESKAAAAAADATYVGTYNLVADEGAFTLTIAKKGKVKVSGTTASGKKVSVLTQLLIGDGVACVPVIAPRVGIAFMLWIGDDVLVEGLTDALAGKAGVLAAGSVFVMDATALAELVGDDSYAAYFPDGIVVEQIKSKWVVAPDTKGKAARAGKVVLGKNGAVDETKLGENPSALKLTYTAKTGAFKGSFRAYVNNKGKPKAVTVSVSGVMIGDCAYGTATVKKESIAIAISVKKQFL